jgi:hypothetical protein
MPNCAGMTVLTVVIPALDAGANHDVAVKHGNGARTKNAGRNDAARPLGVTAV